LWEQTMIRPDYQDPNALDNMKPWKRYCFHKFTMSSCYGKDVTEMLSLDMIANQEDQSSLDLWTVPRVWTLLEFCFVELGLYHADELEEEGFNVYFEGGLRNDDNFNAQYYWLSISREDNLGLSRSHTYTIRNPILRVLYKMITYGLCQRTTGYDKIQKNDLWLLSMFDARHQNGVLTEDVVMSLSALIYYRDLDTTTLRDLIDSNGWGAYNLPGYAQPQYDQYYQQYPPPPLQYQQQQDDDE
ncbi:hypothetical protein Tco_1196285, partial [Tanacetum coccineum]